MNILIADDHNLIIEGFTTYIQKAFPQYHLFAAVDDLELFEQLSNHQIDLLFQDIKFNKTDARDLLAEIRAKYPAMRIVMISTLSDPYIVENVFKKGVDGYVLKADPSDQIIEAIDAVMSGKSFISSGLKHVVQEHKLHAGSKIELTRREKEILQNILEELTTKEIATKLFLSEKTVENHRANIMVKLNVKNTAGLVKRALLDGLV